MKKYYLPTENFNPANLIILEDKETIQEINQDKEF